MTGLAANRIGFSPMFGNYFLELQKFLASFRTFKKDSSTGNYNEISPVVIMGTPTAAYRAIFPAQSNVDENNPKQKNGQVNLPVINFIAQDFRRIFAQENPYARATNGRRSSATAIETVEVFRAPQQWEITYQVSIWTEGYKQRDDLLSRIFTTFRGGDVGLIFYPDKSAYPDLFIPFEYRIDEQVNDETNLEELQEKEGRKFVRTSFVIRGKSQLHYDTLDVPLIKSIEVANEEWRSRGEVLRFDISVVDGEEVIILNPTPFPINP